MPVRSPCPTAPSAAERVRLKKMAYGHKTEHRLRVRAQVVLHAGHGRSHACIARETGLHVDTVRRWRGRFAQAGLSRLKNRQPRGCPSSFTPLFMSAKTCVAGRPRKRSSLGSTASWIFTTGPGFRLKPPGCWTTCCPGPRFASAEAYAIDAPKLGHIGTLLVALAGSAPYAARASASRDGWAGLLAV